MSKEDGKRPHRQPCRDNHIGAAACGSSASGSAESHRELRPQPARGVRKRRASGRDGLRPAARLDKVLGRTFHMDPAGPHRMRACCVAPAR